MAVTVDTAQATAWWAQPRSADNKAWIANYQKSLKARHRTQIVEIVKELAPRTVFEVGAHCGPNLIRLAEEMPGLKLAGIDANDEAVQAGTAWIAQRGLASRVNLGVGRLPEWTDALPNGSCDVVLSCYTLAYIAPSDLPAVLYEFGRLATQAVILAEPMTTGASASSGRTLSGYTEWAHDYQAERRWIGTLSGWTTRIVPVDPPVDRLNGIFVATPP